MNAPVKRAKILNASAGSGKTYQLAYKYVRDVVDRPDSFNTILAVTFTNKATEQMKTRILREINNLAADLRSSYLKNLQTELRLSEAEIRRRARTARTRILHNYSRFTVLTIDRFFQRILRAFIKELGIDLNYNIELETASVLTKSADALIEEITSNKELQRWLTDFVQERIDDGARWDIRDGILALGDELFKERNRDALTVAGDKEALGKLVNEMTTRSISSKCRWQNLGKEALEIMKAAGLSPADFKGGKNSFANYFNRVAGGEVVPPTQTACNCATNPNGWYTKTASPTVIATAYRLQPLLAEICASYDRESRFWNTVDLLRENYRSFALLSDLYAKVRQQCEEENVLFLSETKQILSKFIGHNDAPFIYEKVGNRFERFMIDEFQDTSAKEWQNFLPLLHNAMAQSQETTVLLVGDIKQSIYRWRGGDWKILHHEAAEALGRDNVEVVPLAENYRSLRGIVNFNNLIIGRIVSLDSQRLRDTLSTAASAGAIERATALELGSTLEDAYVSHSQHPCKKSLYEGAVHIETFEKEPRLIEQIKAVLDRGFRPDDILILVRGRRDGARVAQTLLDFKRDNTDPRYRFDIMTQEALVIGNAPVCGFVTAAFYLTVDTGDSIHRAIFNRYLDRAFDAPLSAEEEDFFHTARLLAPEEAFEQIVLRYELNHRSKETAYLQAIHEQIIAFSSGRVADIPLFLEWWEDQGSSKSLSVEQSESTIEIMTIHKAKGLEKKVVMIPYCSWELDPKSGGGINNIVWAAPRTEPPAERHDKGENSLAALGSFPVRCKKTMAESLFSEEYYRELVYSHVDNINLLYVALTRAVEVLCIFIPKQQRGANVGGLLLQSIECDGDIARLGNTTGSHATTESGEVFEFGTATPPEPPEKQEKQPTDEEPPRHVVLEEYVTTQPELKLRLTSDRYFEEGEEVELAPRNLGILMHRIFENAASREEIEANIDHAVADGDLSADEARTLRDAIARQFRQPLAAAWFDGSWNVVRNENEIIVPHNAPIRRARREEGRTAIRRPDRVMVRGDRAVVVDYKFGRVEKPEHRRQIMEYMSLLRDIGYRQVEGYLWYVRLERTVRVEESPKN